MSKMFYIQRVEIQDAMLSVSDRQTFRQRDRYILILDIHNNYITSGKPLKMLIKRTERY